MWEVETSQQSAGSKDVYSSVSRRVGRAVVKVIIRPNRGSQGAIALSGVGVARHKAVGVVGITHVPVPTGQGGVM